MSSCVNPRENASVRVPLVPSPSEQAVFNKPNGSAQGRGARHAGTARATSAAMSPRGGPGQSLVSERRVPGCARSGLLARSGREDRARRSEHQRRSRSFQSLPAARGVDPGSPGEALSSGLRGAEMPERRTEAPRTVAFSKTSAIRMEHPAGVPDKTGGHGARTGSRRETGDVRNTLVPEWLLAPSVAVVPGIKQIVGKTGSEDRVVGKLCSRTNTCSRNPEFLSRLQHKIVLHRVMDFTKVPPSRDGPESRAAAPRLGSGGECFPAARGPVEPTKPYGQDPASCRKYLCPDPAGPRAAPRGPPGGASLSLLRAHASVSGDKRTQLPNCLFFFLTPQILIRNLRFYRNCLIR